MNIGLQSRCKSFHSINCYYYQQQQGMYPTIAQNVNHAASAVDTAANAADVAEDRCEDRCKDRCKDRYFDKRILNNEKLEGYVALVNEAINEIEESVSNDASNDTTQQYQQQHNVFQLNKPMLFREVFFRQITFNKRVISNISLGRDIIIDEVSSLFSLCVLLNDYNTVISVLRNIIVDDDNTCDIKSMLKSEYIYVNFCRPSVNFSFDNDSIKNKYYKAKMSVVRHTKKSSSPQMNLLEFCQMQKYHVIESVLIAYLDRAAAAAGTTVDTVCYEKQYKPNQ